MSGDGWTSLKFVEVESGQDLNIILSDPASLEEKPTEFKTTVESKSTEITEIYNKKLRVEWKNYKSLKTIRQKEMPRSLQGFRWRKNRQREA